MIETDLPAMLVDPYSDWCYVLEYGDPLCVPGGRASEDSFRLPDVEVVIASVKGVNDGEEWLAVLKLKDGSYASIRAGCDYTGWG